MDASRSLCAVIVAFATSGCAVAPTPQGLARAAQPRAAAQPAGAPTVHGPTPAACVEYGLASWYRTAPGRRRTADGEDHPRTTLTGAHPFLPFGTKVRVTDLDTDRSITVRIDDRGPFVPGRIIDLSAAAARQLGMRRDGVVHVRLLAIPGRSGPIPTPAATRPLPRCVPHRDTGQA